MQTLFIILGSILISLGFITYKKIAEPISLYVVNRSIKVTKNEFSEIDEENKALILDIEKLQQVIKRSEE